MKILLTGGAGYIGSHTAVVLSQAGHDVIIYDNFCNSKRDVVHRIEKIINSNILCFEGDIRDEKLLMQIMQEETVGAVIHFAGLKSLSQSIDDPLIYFSNNISGTISLLRAMNSANIKRLVFSSSATVYGPPQYLPVDENHPLRVTNPYGRTKLHIEELLNDLSASDESWRTISLRYFNPVGAHESGLIGEDPSDFPNNIMPILSRVATGKLPSLKVFGRDYSTIDGTGIRDYIHIQDLAEAHLSALDFINDKNNGFRFDPINVGTGRGYSVLELVREYEKVSCKSIPIEFHNRRLGDVETCYASAEKAKSLLGWSASRGIQDMCLSSFNWEKQKVYE